jgi:hypothetical protein
VYSVYDDGLEFFGGAVNVENFIGLYVRDDSLDFDEGYQGTITNALIIQSETDGANCIESDGIGDYGDLDDAQRDAVIAQGINSRPIINHMTCIFSANTGGTHDPGAGPRFREGIWPTVRNSLVIGSFGANDAGSATDNYCLRIDDRSQAAGINGNLNLESVVFACAERGNPTAAWPADGTTTTESFVLAEGGQFATVASGAALNPTAAVDAGLQLLEGTQPFYSIPWATSMVDSAAPIGTTQPVPLTSGGTARTYIGAVSLGDDWTQPWAYGLHPANRGQPLWIE